jgi:N-acetylglutamate synthase-like GNAT family acetyltransferase
MSNYGSERLLTRSGCLFDVRPERAEDEVKLAAFFKHVSADDIRFRFLTGRHEVSHERLSAMTNVDHRQTENFLAFVDHENEIIASATLACDSDLQRGEVSIAVRSDFKNDGVGWELLAHVARHAEAMGVKRLESIESRDNHAAIELERNMGFTVMTHPDDATLLLVQRTLGTGPSLPTT